MKPQKKTLQGPLMTDLEIGQAYVDEPVYKTHPVFCGNEPETGEVLSHYKRTPLRWMKPGPNGRLVPK